MQYSFSNAGTNKFSVFLITDENSNSINVSWNTNGTLNNILDYSGRYIDFYYDTNNRLTSVTDALNHQWALSYDTNGNLAQIKWPIINGIIYSDIFGYDTNHNIISYQDKRGNIATAQYNTDGSVIWEKDFSGNQTSFNYGTSSTTITDANNHSIIHTYNTNGQLASVTDASGHTEYYTYDSNNNLSQLQDRQGNLWKFTYDSMGNALTAKDPLTHTTTYTYNSHNKILTKILPSNRSIVNSYDANDNLTKVQEKDAGGSIKATTTYTIGSYGLISSKTDNNNHATQYGYDGNGNLISVTTPGNHTTKWTYDWLGFKTSRTDAMNRATNYTPDAWERLVTTTYPDSTTATLAYDPDGNITQFTNYTGVFSRAYDSDNRLTSESYNFTPGVPTQILGHTYDATGKKGLLSTTTDVNGRVITYAYTVRNELYTVADTAGTATYTYDNNGNQTRYTAPNGLLADSYYFNDNTLDSQYDWNGGSTILASFGYNYTVDAQISNFNEGTNGNLHVTPNSTVTNYGYDGQGHLTTETRNGVAPLGQTYGVDGVGNRTSLTNGAGNTFTYDSDDEVKTVTGANAFTLSYNANGDRTQETFNGQLTTFGYDYDDQLTSIAAPGQSLSYQYDALGRQVNRTVNGVTTGLYSDGDKVLVEKGTSSSLSYTWGNGLIRAGGEYPLTDGRGNARLTTNASQQLMFSNAPDAFGISAFAPSSASAYSHRADFGYREEGVGPAGLGTAYSFQKVGARYYDPTLGCFLTRDTELDQKPFAYCDGDPVNFIDPDGHRHRIRAFFEFLYGASAAAIGITYSVTTEGVGAIFGGSAMAAAGGALIGKGWRDWK